MRAHTSLRTAFRIGMMTAFAAGITLASTQAHAGDVDPGTGSSGAGGVNTSTGTAALKFEYSQALPTTITTPEFGPSFAKASIGIKIEPVKNAGPLFTVDMPKGAVVQASWGTDKKILLKAANGSQTDGTVKVRHSLAPSINLKLSAFGINANLAYDATSLVNKIPGAKFAYDSTATQQFAPWGFTGVETKLNAPDLANAQLFSIGFDKLPELVAENATGYLGVRAVTKPTFMYKTTKVVMSGTSGEITTAGGELTVDAVDGDYMELMTALEGEMTVKGALSVQPFVHVDKVGNLTINSDIAYDVYSKDYETPATKTQFQSALVHIPLPNVHAPSAGVDVGDVKVGGSASKTVEIENSGEMAATMTFKSSDGQFQVTSETVTVAPKGKYELLVKFSPDSANPAMSEITVASNDPDSPSQTFKIGANGADVGQGDDEGDISLPKGPEGDSGCGCKAAGTTSTIPSWAGLGVLGLGAVVLFRRRRSS